MSHCRWMNSSNNVSFVWFLFFLPDCSFRLHYPQVHKFSIQFTEQWVRNIIHSLCFSFFNKRNIMAYLISFSIVGDFVKEKFWFSISTFFSGAWRCLSRDKFWFFKSFLYFFDYKFMPKYFNVHKRFSNSKECKKYKKII